MKLTSDTLKIKLTSGCCPMLLVSINLISPSGNGLLTKLEAVLVMWISTALKHGLPEAAINKTVPVY